MLLLSEGQAGEAWKPSKSNALSAIGEYWTELQRFLIGNYVTAFRITGFLYYGARILSGPHEQFSKLMTAGHHFRQ